MDDRKRMSSYTAEAYRAAAEIARRTSPNDLAGDLADEWESEADRMDKLADYGLKLSEKIRERTRNMHYEVSPEAWGMQLMAALLEDGWTAPEGLF